MENIRVIKLNPNTYISNVSTFDEAFDEYSLASGKRKQKKADKIRAKAEKQRAKAELQQARGEKKVARVGKRTARKVARQEGRDTISSMRQARRTANKTARVERRKIGQEQEPEIDETTIGTEQDTIVDETNGNGGYRSLPPEFETNQDNTQSEEDYQGDYSPEQGEWGEQPNYSEDEGDVNDSNDSEQEYGDEYDTYSNEDEPDFNFDGNIQNDDEFNDLEQASQVIDIPEAITIIADKIEWNKELYSRLDGKKKEIIQINPGANIDELDTQISDRADRIADLEDLLDGWANCKYNYNANNQFEEFPNIDIDYSNADGKNKFAKMKRNRYKQVQKARENAKKKREAITVVKTSLNPIFENGKIVVPSTNPSSSFEGIPEGTGLNGLDNSDDFDAPPTLTYEITSNADGSGKTNINMTGIVIGVAVGLLGIWAIKKYKLIK